GIRPLTAARPDFPFPLDPIGKTWKQLKLLASNKPLMRTALGIAFFWTLATLTQANVKVYGKTVLALGEKDIGPLMLALVIGIGLGSVLAGIWSGGRVELGIVPLGAMGIVVTSLALFVTGSDVQHSRYAPTILWLVLLGAGAGLFNVPLESFLQHR